MKPGRYQFFYLHVPVVLGVAALAGTSLLQAAIMAAIVLIGPTLVYFWFHHPRALDQRTRDLGLVLDDLGHGFETRTREHARPPTGDERRALDQRWRTFNGKLDALHGAGDRRRVEIADEDLQRVRAARRGDAPIPTVNDGRLEPTALRFARVADQASRLARRMGKTIEVEIDDRGLRLDPRRWAPFWSTFVAAVRDAIDHGIEDAAERRAFGKPAAGRIALRSIVENGALRIELGDDGRGVNWDREVTDLSGRGVELSALRAATAHEGGVLTILSEPRRGTCLRFDFVLDAGIDLALRPEGRSSQRIHMLSL